MAADERFWGKTLAETDLRRRFGVTVIGRWRGESLTAARKLEALGADELASKGDILLVAGADDALERFAGLVEPSSA